MAVVLNVGDNAPQGAISFFKWAVEQKGRRGGAGAEGGCRGRWSKPNL